MSLCLAKTYSQNFNQFSAKEVDNLWGEIRNSLRYYKCHYGLIQSTKPQETVMYKHLPVKTVRSRVRVKNYTLLPVV